MFVKNIPFAVSISANMKFSTAKAIFNNEDSMITGSINIVKAKYPHSGFVK